MNQDLSDYRKSYEKSELLEDQIPENPIKLFHKWFHEVDFGSTEEANAMTLSTFGLDNYPKSRVVLLKQFSDKGFVFFTNYESEKGKAIANNPNVCLSFFWQSFERQVIIKGKAEKISREESQAYFSSRPEGSRLGAIVSKQSQVISSREYLDQKLEEANQHFQGKEISMPEYWGGYIVIPQQIEFWQGRANRLHDRIRFNKSEQNSWKIERLSP